MRRTQIYITDEQQRRISERASDAGVPKAEIIRGLLDEGLGLDDGLAARERAIVATAGVLEGAEDWPQWLARVRGSTAAERLGRLDP